MYSAKCGTYSSKFRPCREALAELYTKLLLTYPIILLEDPFEEESFYEFTKFTSLVDCQVSAKMTREDTQLIKQRASVDMQGCDECNLPDR